MRPKIYMKDGDGEGSGDGRSGAAAKIVLPPLSCSPPAAKTKPEGAALSELPKMKRQTSMETMESGSKRIPSFRHRNTFRSSRQKDQKMKASRLIFHNHSSPVRCVTSMNNYHRLQDEMQDTLLISGGDDKTVYINSLLLGITRRKLSGHTQRISGLATYIGPGYPSCVISSSWDETIRIWKVDDCFLSANKTDIEVCVKDSWKTLTGHTNRICCVKVFTVYPEYTRKISGKCKTEARASRVESEIESCPMIASGSTDGSIKIWNFKSLGNNEFNTDCLFTIIDELNITWYLCLEFFHTPEAGHVLISGSKDNFVRLWSLDDVVTGSVIEGSNSKPIRVIHGHLSKITNLSLTTESATAFNDVGKACLDSKRVYRIVTTCHDLIVRVFSLEGELLRTLNEVPTPITGLAVRDSLRDKCDIIITAGSFGGIRVWRSLSGELLHVFNGFPGPCNAVLAIPSPDMPGDVVVFSGGADHTSRVFLYSVEKSLRVLQHRHIEHKQNVVKVNVVKTFIQEGIVSPLVFAGCNDGTIWCWLLNRGEAEAVKKYSNCIHSSRVRALAIHTPVKSEHITTIAENSEADNISGTAVQDSHDEADYDFSHDHINDSHAFNALPVAFTPEEEGEARPASTFNLDLSQPYILSAGRDRDIMVTLIDSGVPVAKIHAADTHSITSLDLYADQNNSNIEPFILSGSESNCARLFSLQHGNLLQVLKGHDFDVTCVRVFTPKYKPPPPTARDGTSASVSRSTSRQNSARGLNSMSLLNSGAAVSHLRNPIIFTCSMDNNVIIWVYDCATSSFIQDTMLTESQTYLSCLDICQLDDKPVIAAGNGDGDVYMWAINNQMAMDQRDIEYSLLFVFTGQHSDEIFDVAIFNPEGLPPILTSGSGDNTLILWSLETMKPLQLLEGHDGDITSVTLFAPDCSEPMLASASIDGSIRVLSDFLGFVPKMDSVDQAYQLDEKDRSEAWSRISGLVNKFQADSFFQLFYCLFFRALESGLSDFLKLFLPLSMRALVRSNAPVRLDMKGFSDDYELKSLLRLAMDKHNVPAVHIIISCWVTFFTRPVHDWEGDLVYDEKCNIQHEDLLMLAHQHPSEFSRLICSITLVPLEINELQDGVYFLDVGGKDEDMELMLRDSSDPATSANPSAAARVARAKDNDDSCHDEFTFLSLPIKNLCHISLMKAYVATCETTDDAGIFDSDVGILTLAYCWRLYGRSYHINSMKVYLFYAALSSLTLFSFKGTRHHEVWQYVPVVLMAVQLILSLNMFRLELRQLYEEKIAYFNNVWNLNDFIVILGSTCGNTLRLIYWEERDTSRVLLSLSIICVYFKVLFFLRAFETSGPLVSMIIQIWKDMQSLVGIIALVIIGFSQAFWLLSEVDSDLPFAQIQNSFLNSYSFMLGGYDPEAFDGATLQVWATFLSVIFMLVMNLLLLNLLIALMGNSYSVVQEKGNAQWRLEQTQVVLDHASQLPEGVKTHSMVHVRQRTEVLKRIRDERESRSSSDIESMKNMIQALEGKLEASLQLLHAKQEAKDRN